MLLWLLWSGAMASELPVVTESEPLFGGSGPWVGAGVQMVGMIDSCDVTTPTLSGGYRWESPFDRAHPATGGGFFVAGAEVTAMPCRGGAARALGETGVRLGPVDLGVYGLVGPAWSRDPAGPPISAGMGISPALTISRVSLRGHLGLTLGYRDQGWLETGVSLRVRL